MTYAPLLKYSIYNTPLTRSKTSLPAFSKMGDGKTMKQKTEEKLNSGNAGHIGDPTSLKNESSSGIPTETEAGAKPEKEEGHKTLKQVAQETNPTMLGDPVSLKAETSNSEPTDQDRGAQSKKRDSKI